MIRNMRSVAKEERNRPDPLDQTPTTISFEVDFRPNCPAMTSAGRLSTRGAGRLKKTTGKWIPPQAEDVSRLLAELTPFLARPAAGRQPKIVQLARPGWLKPRPRPRPVYGIPDVTTLTTVREIIQGGGHDALAMLITLIRTCWWSPGRTRRRRRPMARCRWADTSRSAMRAHRSAWRSSRAGWAFPAQRNWIVPRWRIKRRPQRLVPPEFESRTPLALRPHRRTGGLR